MKGSSKAQIKRRSSINPSCSVFYGRTSKKDARFMNDPTETSGNLDVCRRAVRKWADIAAVRIVGEAEIVPGQLTLRLWTVEAGGMRSSFVMSLSDVDSIDRLDILKIRWQGLMDSLWAKAKENANAVSR